MNFTYYALDSYLHRLSAGCKLLVLLGISTLTIWMANGWILSGIGITIVLLKYLSKLPWMRILPLQKTFLIILLCLGAWVAWVNGWQAALLVVVRWWFLMILTGIFLLSTSLSAIMQTLERALYPLHWLGISPYRVSVGMILTIRLIPYVQELLREILEAQKARGLERHWIAIIVPLCVRLMTSAQNIADAMDARGFDQPYSHSAKKDLHAD